MSESAPERTGGGGGNVFARKLGPLPMWAWMGLALLVALGYYLYHKNQSAGNTSGATTSPSTVNTPGGVDSSLVPQFVNQVYNQETPPPAPNVTVNNNVPSSGTTTPPASTPALQETFSKGHVISPSHTKATVGWTNSNVGASGATQLKVGIDGPGLGPGGSDSINPVYRYIPASATTATFDNLKAGHNYTVTVLPIDSKGHAVGPPGYVDLKTT